MKTLVRFARFVDKLNNRIGRLTSWLSAVLVLIISYDVISRYLFNVSSVAMQELEWHIFAVIFLTAAAYTLSIDDHVRVDVFYSRFSVRRKAWINLFGSVLFLIPFSTIVILASIDFVGMSIRVGETSPDAGGLPGRFILKAFIPISFFLLFLQGISIAVKNLLVIKSSNTEKGLPADD